MKNFTLGERVIVAHSKEVKRQIKSQGIPNDVRGGKVVVITQIGSHGLSITLPDSTGSVTGGREFHLTNERAQIVLERQNGN